MCIRDRNKLKHAIVDYKVGSILNVTGHALTVDQWHTVITQIQDETKNTRLKIPVIYGLDGIHGQTYTLDATLFPQSIAMAATRDTALAKKAAKITAMELRASGVRWNFAPVLDCGRQELKSLASTIMINSGEINGLPVHASKYLLTDVIRKELGVKCVIVTDWEDIK